MRIRCSIKCIAVFLLMAGGSAGASAQEAPGAGLPPSEGPPPAAQPLREGGLVFEREMFTYPLRARRNPFQPLPVSVAEGPRFEELGLLGIIHHRDPRGSVVLLGARPPSGRDGEEATGVVPLATYRLRLGDVIGSTRIVQIHERHVVVEMDGPEGPQRKVLRVPLASEGRES